MQPKPLCAMAKLDTQSEAKIADIKKHLCTRGVACDIVPAHLTLGIYENLAPEKLQQWTTEFAAKQTNLPISFSHIGFFGSSVCFIAPQVTHSLLNFHQDYHKQLDEYCGNLGKNYSAQNQSWVPHCTLFLGNKQDIETTIPLLTELFTPFCATIEGIVLGYFSNNAQQYSLSSIISEHPFSSK